MSNDVSKKIILDLCGGTGAWSLPYKQAGYDVRVITLPGNDVMTYKPPKNVYGILAAPPCTMFSLARTKAKEPRNVDKGLIIVAACLSIIWAAKPKFWAMENPRGLLRKYMGAPAFSFDASEFGEEYNKHTDLWGYFNSPRKFRSYLRYNSTDKNTRKLPELPPDYEKDKKMTNLAMRRSITPASFAQEFYIRNT